MRLNTFEFVMVHNPLRAWLQRILETPRMIGPQGALTGQRVLEVGCGQGAGIEILLDWGASQVTGFDLDPRVIAMTEKRLRKYGERARVYVGNAEQMDLPDANLNALVEYNAPYYIHGWRVA